MSERMTDEQWFTIRNMPWSRAQQSEIRRELDRARAAEDGLASAFAEAHGENATQAAEIERLKERILALDAGNAEAFNREQRLKAERARLTSNHSIVSNSSPSGQVAEDQHLACAGLSEMAVAHERTAGWAAVLRLAAKAHGYEAAVARAEEAEKQARVAWERHAEKDRAYGDAISQRDAAVADNAALLERCQRLLADDSDEAWTAFANCVTSPHPGAALLKERQEREEVVKALGAFLASVQHVGPKGCPAGECGLCDALRLAGVLP